MARAAEKSVARSCRAPAPQRRAVFGASATFFALALLTASSFRAHAAEDGGASRADASSVSDDGGLGQRLPTCVRVGTTSRYVPFGYDHVVDLQNDCVKVAVCDVSTDVNPAVTVVELAAGQRTSILTFAGSPAQAFVARVSCKLQR